jgi:hypothetical protein
MARVSLELFLSQVLGLNGYRYSVVPLIEQDFG